MKCVNVNLDVPRGFYVFLDYGQGVGDAVNANNFAITNCLIATGLSDVLIEGKRNYYLEGEIVYPPFAERCGGERQASQLSSFALLHQDDYLERRLEEKRYETYPRYPSRLACVFAFGDLTACHRAAERHGWDMGSVKQFHLLDLGEFNKFVRISRHNMDIISLLRSCDPAQMQSREFDMALKAYWEGEGELPRSVLAALDLDGTIPKDPIYEYLVVGALELDYEGGASPVAC